MMFPLAHGLVGAAGGGGAWSPLELVDGTNGDAYDFLDKQYLYQSATMTDPVASDGDTVWSAASMTGVGPWLRTTNTNSRWNDGVGVTGANFATPENPGAIAPVTDGVLFGVSFIDSPGIASVSGFNVVLPPSASGASAPRYSRQTDATNIYAVISPYSVMNIDSTPDWEDGDGNVNSLIMRVDPSVGNQTEVYLNGVLKGTFSLSFPDNLGFPQYNAHLSTDGLDSRHIRRAFVYSGDTTIDDVENLDAWLRASVV